jgi:ferritin-like protein
MGAAAAILPFIIEAIKAAPTLVKVGADVVHQAKDLWETVTSEDPATPEQQQQVDDALRAAHEAFQAATADVEEDQP